MVEKTEKDKKAEAKIIDETDENFCGFIGLQLVDQDGYPRVIKGSQMGAPLQLRRKDGKVVLEAHFTPNPLYYLHVLREPQLFLTGELWYGEAKKSPTNLIGKLVPKSSSQLVEVMEKCKTEEFTVKLEVPFLANAPSRLLPLVVGTKDEKFCTKVIYARAEFSEKDWAEWKAYRLQFWRVHKAWGSNGGDDEEKKEGKDGEKKNEEEKDK